MVTLNPDGGRETTTFTLCERSGLSRVRVKSSSRLKFKAILWVLLCERMRHSANAAARNGLVVT